MALRPEISVGASLATAALVYGIFTNATPPITDIRAAQAGNDDVDRSERQASWLAAGTVGAVSLVAKDPNIFIVGGLMVIGMAWWTRHANHTDPATGRLALGLNATSAAQMADAGNSNAPTNYNPEY